MIGCSSCHHRDWGSNPGHLAQGPHATDHPATAASLLSSLRVNVNESHQQYHVTANVLSILCFDAFLYARC